MRSISPSPSDRTSPPHPPSSRQSTALFVRYLLTSPGSEERVILPLLQRALTLAARHAALLLVASRDLSATPLRPLTASAQVLTSRPPGAHLYEIPRDIAVPRVSVRRAREEDHDDLLPVLATGAKVCPPLAELPVTEAEQEYALARIIARQDADNCILVAEVNGRPVGVMALTCNLDTTQLLAAFDLHTHDGLTKPEAYDALYARAEELAQMRAIEAAAERAEEEQGPDDRDGGPAVLAPPSAMALSAAMLDILSDPAEADALPLNSFAVSLFCIDPGYEFAVPDLLRAAFAAFPALDYCLVSVPHAAPQPPALSDFQRIPPLSGVAFPDLLFVFHRHGLSGPLRTRAARAEDRFAVEALVEGTGSPEQAAAVLAAFDLATSTDPSSAFATLSVCEGEAVAVTVLGPSADPAAFSRHYRINSLVDCDLQPHGAFARVLAHTADPIFAHRSGDVLAETCALFNRRFALYHHEPTDGHLPEFARNFLQVPGRRAGAALVMGEGGSDSEPSTALFLFAPRMAHSPRRQINSRIVFVGGSTCAMAAIEALLAHPTLAFNTITLVSPQGLRASESVGGSQGRFTQEEINRAGFPGRVVLVEGRLAELDRESREVILEEGFAVPYDVLVVATGLRAAEAERLRADQEPTAAARIITGPEDIHEGLTLRVPLESLNEPGPSAAKHGGDYGALLVGEGPEVLEAAHKLLALGVLPSRIALALPTAQNFVTAARAASAALGSAGGPLAGMPVLAPSEPQGAAGRSLLTVQEVRAAHADDLRHGLIVRFEQNEGGQSQPGPSARCHLLVLCDRTDVSRSTFRAVTSQALVFDGRVVVDGLFRSQDPAVLAVGPCAKFSRGVRGAANRPHELMDKREIGEELAKAVAMTLDAGSHPRAMSERTHRAPLILRPALREAPLPGTALNVMVAAAPSVAQQPDFGAAAPGRVVRSVQPSAALLVGLTPGNSIDRILFCGPPDAPAQRRLSSLVGLNATYFGPLLAEDENPGLLGGLQSPLFECFFHDSFVEVRRALLSAAMNAPPVKAPPAAPSAADDEEEGAEVEAEAAVPKGLVRAALMEFVRGHASDLGQGGYSQVPRLSLSISASLRGSKFAL